MAEIVSVELIVGLEVHVELSTRTKMFSRALNGAHPERYEAAPNTLIDPVVLGLPGALPVMNRAAVEKSVMVGLALGCQIAGRSVWDRKSYFYPDLPKNYQISQYQLPLCFDGSVELPPIAKDGKIDYDAMAVGTSTLRVESGESGKERHAERGGTQGVESGESGKERHAERGGTQGSRIGIIRAHLEEDAGKLLHEAPGGMAIEGSIADYNRAGTPLLEIVTRPDFRDADEVVVFCRVLRNICRFLGASEGVLQRGHMRFEPNINCVLTLSDGRTVKTPIVEIKNLNSFKAVKGAIEFEKREQPRRWAADGIELRPGAKTTRGWDDQRGETFLQREKEEAHDYRYFPDPDLLPVEVDEAWRERVRKELPELPLARTRRYMREFGLSAKESAAITDERDVCLFFEAAMESASAAGVGREKAGRLAANFVLQSGAKRANERSTPERVVLVSELGIGPQRVGEIVRLRDAGIIGSNAADELFGLLCEGGEEHGATGSVEEVARQRGMVIVQDAGAMEGWCERVVAANPKVAEDVRGGKVQAVGRLVGEVMKLAAASGGAADAKAVRETLLRKLGPG